MNLEKFEKLDEDKRNRIIEAAMNEFIINGYLAASTNNIVKSAGISKGSLFNYFDNKEKLFLYLLRINLEKLIFNFKNKKELSGNLNLFDGVRFFVNTIVEFFTKNPKTFEFLTKGIISAPLELRTEILNKKKEFQAGVIRDLVMNSKTDYFKPGIKRENIEFIVLTLVDTISNKFIEKYAGDIKKFLKYREERENEIEELVNLLKFGILNREDL